MSTPRPSSMARLLLVVALVLLALGVVVGVAPVSAEGTGCGSAFFASKDAEVADFAEAINADSRGLLLDEVGGASAACGDLRSVLRIPAIGLLVVGAGLGIAGLSLRGRERGSA